MGKAFKLKIICITACLIKLCSWESGYSQVSFSKSKKSFTNAGITGGVAWIDVSNDHYPELIFTNFGLQKNHFYSNHQGKLSFEKNNISNGNYSGISAADVDNDGFIEVLATTQQNQHNVMLQYSGKEWNLYKEDSEFSSDYGDSYSSSLFDLENDGDLDLYIANGSFQPGFLYVNEKGKFTRTNTDLLGPLTTATFGVSAADIDKNGFQDLFVANKAGNNYVYLNKGNGSLVSLESDIIVEDGGNSNGGSWGDFDNDGDLDLYVANGAFSGKGEADFLYRNGGNGKFSKVMDSEVTNEQHRSMSGTWGDYDNDGDLDLIVTRYKNTSQFFQNDGSGEFCRIDIPAFENEMTFATGIALADYDFDGDLDIALANWENLNNVLFENNSKAKEWIRFKLIGTESNKSGIGAKVSIRTSEGNQFRELVSSHGFRSQNDFTAQLHFGLNNIESVEKVEIIWPSGQKTNLTNLKSKFLYVVEERTGIVDKIKPISAPANSTEQLVSIYFENNLEYLVENYFDKDSNAFPGIGKYVSVGVAIGGAGRVFDAKKIFQLASQHYRESSQPVFWNAFIDRLIGDTQAAESGFKKALQMVQNDPHISELEKEEIVNTSNYELSKIGN